ncbi:MAG TPA: TraB/GumN family protein, partial [Nevskiaceae bacterium]|nr:TraB/GumN family protein [Nevskiaceae bacterium]
PAAHLALFSGMDRRLGRAMLRAAVAPDDSGLASPQAVYRAWRDDDVAAVAGFDSRFKQRYPALYARLIANRNRAWMPKLQALLDGQDGQLIVVGAAHLVGPDGLVGALRAAGYRVAPGLAATGHELRTRWLMRGRP